MTINEHIATAIKSLDECDDVAAQVHASIALTLAITALSEAPEQSLRPLEYAR